MLVLPFAEASKSCPLHSSEVGVLTLVFPTRKQKRLANMPSVAKVGSYEAGPFVIVPLYKKAEAGL